MSTLDRTSFPEEYYAVIFSYQSGSNLDGYSEMDEETIELAQTMPGFLGY